MENIFDIIILGGGIAGLYSAHKIAKSHPNKTMLILEKDNVLGGRIKTYKDDKMQVEAGAGRFHDGHKKLLSLLGELDLAKYMIKIDAGNTYYDIHTKTPIKNPNIPLLAKLVSNSSAFSTNELRNMSLIRYASHVLSKDEIKTIEDTFGYYTELVMMSAADCLTLITEQLSPKNTFYTLNGGLRRIIDKLEENLTAHKTMTILRKHNVLNIRRDGFATYEVSFHNRKITYKAKQIISALPKQVLEKIQFFSPIHNILKKSIFCGSLCRIYSVFPVKNGKSWFDNLPKFTTNNNLRIVIPIDAKQGVIMSSYSDNKFSKFWKEIYNKGGEQYMNRELVRLLQESTGIMNIPMPTKTEIFYWEYGVGYWKIGIDSEDVSKKIIQPLKGENVFICGESYSLLQQQWMEGALETADIVAERIK